MVEDIQSAATVADLVATSSGTADLAVVSADGSLTYGDLLERADAIAVRLRECGQGDGDLVAVSLPRSAALIAACLGVWRTGAAYLTIDPSQPPDRIQRLVADSGVATVLAAGDSPTDVAVVPVDSRPEHPPTRQPGVAYVLYTSGSTGAPKGVMVEHAGLANLTRWHAATFGVSRGTRCAQIASPGFDASVWEIWGALAAGATVYVVPEDLRTDPPQLRDWLCRNRVEVCFLPTPLAELALRLEWPADAALRVLLTGGDRLRAAPPPGLPFDLVNNYGVTEASVVSTSGVVAAAPPREVEVLPSIGRPIDGVLCRVLGDQSHPVPDGEVGELVVGGVSVARGYLHRPDLSAQRFFDAPDPATGAPVRWYRTGDLVRYRPDGSLDYAGRVDDQVQLRGQRIEPAEVEAAIDRHPAVARSVVVVTGEGHGAHLTAYLEPESRAGGQAVLAEVRELVAASLPPPMVPAAFRWIETVPVTASGKVDRAVLRRASDGSAPIVVLPPSAAPHVGVDADAELVDSIAATVAELLGVDRIAPDDDFLLLGGHSLLGAQLVTRLSETFGVELSMRSLFAAPTPLGMAAEIRRLLVEQVAAIDDETARELLAGADPE